MRILITLALLSLVSCAVPFNKKKSVEVNKVMGEAVFKQDGKIVNKLQVFDDIGKNETEKEVLSELKNDYILALSAAGVGGFLITSGVLSDDGANRILLGGGLFGLAYYYGLQVDKKLDPYVKKHNQRTSFFTPELFPDDSGKLSTLGFKFSKTY